MNEILGIDGGVVIGFDGSDSSQRALRSAAEQAELRGAVLHVVRAWTLTNAPRPADFPLGAVPSTDEYREAVVEKTEEMVNATLGLEPPCRMRVHAPHGQPGPCLVDASKGADLLVVGHRGYGGFAGMLLGSVATQCVRNANCPVLVVRPNV